MRSSWSIREVTFCRLPADARSAEQAPPCNGCWLCCERSDSMYVCSRHPYILIHMSHIVADSLAPPVPSAYAMCTCLAYRVANWSKVHQMWLRRALGRMAGQVNIDAARLFAAAHCTERCKIADSNCAEHAANPSFGSVLRSTRWLSCSTKRNSLFVCAGDCNRIVVSKLSRVGMAHARDG